MTRREDLLDHAVELFPAPDQAHALEQLRRRHHRRQRNQRLAAGGIGVAITIAIVSFAVGVTRSSGPTPADTETPTPSTAISTVSDGRMLFVIMHDDRSVPAYVDQSGLHRIASYPVKSFFHVAWASSDEVVFDGKRDGSLRHVYRMSIDGGTVTQLTSGTAEQIRPAISPDGTLIAYDDYRGREDLGIHLANAADGSDPRALLSSSDRAPRGYDTGAAFSPDGAWIAFSRVIDQDRARAAIFVVRTDGTGLRRLTNPALNAGYARWSPDGQSILFTQSYFGASGGPLWTVPFPRGKATALTNHTLDEWAFEGDWSPDGTQIVFKYWKDGMDGNELRIVNADGSGERTLWVGQPGQTAETPDWGP